MAITSRVYVQFLYGLAGAQHDLYYDTQRVCLLEDTYTPDYSVHSVYSDVLGFEIAAAGDYSAGGPELQNKSTMDTATSYAVKADPVFLSALQAQFRYAVVYRQGNTANTSQLMVCVDFGETLTYTGDDFTLDFTDGVIAMKVPV